MSSSDRETESFGHVRVKRGKTTVFVVIDVEGGATARDLRVKAAHAFGVSSDALEIRSRALGGAVFMPLRDEQALSEQGVEIDGVVCAVLRDEHGEWEEAQLDFVRPPRTRH